MHARTLKAALRRAAKRHSWTDARVGMMQRIMSVSYDEQTGKGGLVNLCSWIVGYLATAHHGGEFGPQANITSLL